jgi:UDPglucose--hexose-1-phosphate uridylyltransferase
MRNPSTNEMRFNPVTGEWVIYATARRARPDEMRSRTEVRSPTSSYEPSCPFCPGNEHMLPGILLDLGGDGGGWKVRVVPNRYPALAPEGASGETLHGVYRVMQGIGHHEVVIESKYHDSPIGTLSTVDAEFVIEAYHRRYRELAAKPGIRSVFVFRNHGVAGGTSLAHPHSQIIATVLAPKASLSRRIQFLSHFKMTGRCLFCHIFQNEAIDGKRVLSENDDFVSFVPYAAEVPCETWVLPKAHRSDFGNIVDKEKASLAEELQSALARLREKLNDPDYNFVIHSALFPGAGEAAALHWYVQIQPHLTIPAGFEMGSGVRINPSLPEADAAFLKEQ